MSAYINVEILGGVWGFIGSIIIVGVVGYLVGRREGYEKGNFEGFREGAIAGVEEKYAKDEKKVQEKQK